VVRIEDFYTTCDIKSMGLAKITQNKRVRFLTTGMEDGSAQVNADCN